MKLSVGLSFLFVSSLASAEPGAFPAETGGTRPDGSGVRDRGQDERDHAAHRSARVVATADAGVRAGPVGAAISTGLHLRKLLDVDESRAFDESYVQAGVGLMVTPATFEPRAHVEYVPAPFLALRGELGAIRYFGASRGLLRFDDEDAPFGDDELTARSGDEHAAWAIKGSLALMPRAKLGPVIARTKLAITGYRFDDPGPYVYEAENDTLLSTSDFILTAHTDLWFQLLDGPGARTLLLGPMTEALRTGETSLSRTRLGGSAFWVPVERFLDLHEPRLYAMAGVNLSDPNRAGAPFASFGIGADIE